MSWFWRGFQSAVFYYLSCAPCMTYAHQRERAKANRRAKAIKAAQRQTEGIYVHPSPFDTNVYWHEEMVLGPGPPQKKGNRDRTKVDSTRRLNTGGQGSSTGASSGDTTLIVQSFDGIQEGDEEDEEGWNRKRYQRADEHLWGQDDPGTFSYLSLGSSAASKPIVRSSGTFYGSRNPAVNDLHPPVVSTQPTHPNQTRWMLQPPPPARVMEGKERANRSRSTSTVSYSNASRGTGGAMAGRQVSLRQSVEESIKEGSAKSVSSARPPKDLDQSSNLSGQRHDRDFEPSSDPETSVPTPTKKKRPPPIRVIDEHKRRSARTRSSVAKSRPKLMTIESSEHTLPESQAKILASSAALSSVYLDPRSAALPSASSSLQALQDLIPTGSRLNAKSPNPSQEACIRLPTATAEEVEFLALPEIDSRFPGGESFRFPSACSELSPSETGDRSGTPAQRWSLDL